MSRRDALSDDQRTEIWSLHLRRVPQTEIARQLGCNRNTVSAVVRRLTAELAERRQTEMTASLDEALATYSEVQRAAWERLQECSPESTIAVGYLGTIVDARRQQDRLLGLERLTVDHTHTYLARVEALLRQPVSLIQEGE